MDEKVAEQLRNVASLPGIVRAAYAMPDAHWGYGFPVGGVAAFDADEGGVVSAGGVGFDASCGAAGQRYLGAMRCAINCALANREIIGHFTRRVFAQFFPGAELPLLFDVSHNTCKVKPHLSGCETRQLYIHRKGATRAFGPNHPGLPHDLKPFGQPVLIGGSMGTASYVLAGAASSEERAFSSACHGAGRQMSRHQALKNWSGRQIVDELKGRGIIVKSPSQRGVAEEAPGAYKDVGEVVDATEMAGLAKKVAKLTPVICIKG